MDEDNPVEVVVEHVARVAVRLTSTHVQKFLGAKLRKGHQNDQLFGTGGRNYKLGTSHFTKTGKAKESLD